MASVNVRASRSGWTRCSSIPKTFTTNNSSRRADPGGLGYSVAMVSLDRPSVEITEEPPKFRPYTTEDASWAVSLLGATGGRYRVRRGQVVDPAGLPGIVAERNGHPNALLSIRRQGVEGFEFVCVASMPFDDELVAGLLAAGRTVLGEQCRRVFAICSNADFDVQRALQTAGFRLCTARTGAIEAVAHRSSMPIVRSFRGIGVNDELEYEWLLTPG